MERGRRCGWREKKSLKNLNWIKEFCFAKEVVEDDEAEERRKWFPLSAFDKEIMI